MSKLDEATGQIVEIWRYPVSSVGGERVTSAALTAGGLDGDRCYGLIDGLDGEPAAPERDARWRKALHLTAAYLDDRIPALTFPDGCALRLDGRTTHEALSDHFGFHVSVAAYDHSPHPGSFPISRYRHRHFPVHLLTTSSLDRLSRLGSLGTMDSRRFRPTVVVETAGEGFVENDWIGRRVALGCADLAAREATKRCGMTLFSQPGLDEDPEVLRNILRHNARNLGIYCTVERSATVTVGDEVSLRVGLS